MSAGVIAVLAAAPPRIAGAQQRTADPTAVTVAPSAAGVASSAPAARSGATTDTVALSLDDVRRLTIGQNPSFLAARQETAIARGGLRQARVYRFNPDLSLVTPGVGVGGARNATELTLMQEIEFAGQRGLRIGAARTGMARASSAVQNAARLTLADASTAFYRALAAERRLAVTQDALTLTERLLGAVRTQLREGEISTLEGNLAEIEFGRARGRVLASQREANGAQLELKRLVGLEPDVAVRLVDGDAPLPVAADARAGAQRPTAAAMVATAPPPSAAGPAAAAALDADSLVALALARRPDLAAASAAVREAEAQTSLARREAIPNLRVGAFAERNQGEDSPRIGPAIGLSLPFLNRSQGVVDARRAEARQAQLERQATALRVRTEVATAVRAYQTASGELAVFESSVREPARQNSALLETAFNAGKIALPTLLLLRNQLLDAELGYWDAWLARRAALVELDAASGALAIPAASADESSSRPPQ